MRRVRSRLLLLISLATLLLMQQFGVQHGLSHFVGGHSPTTVDSALPAAEPAFGVSEDGDEASPHSCLLCLAHAALGLALPSALTWAFRALPGSTLHRRVERVAIVDTPTHYQARAPPPVPR